VTCRLSECHLWRVLQFLGRAAVVGHERGVRDRHLAGEEVLDRTDYTEGNAWQYSWYVPQDVAALIKAMGGDDKFVSKLDSVFEAKVDKSHFANVEDITGLIGWYAHGNEPSHHLAYLYDYAGAPWQTQR